MASRNRPRAVQQAADRADQIHAEVYPDEEATAQNPPETLQEPPAAPPASPAPESPQTPPPAPQAPPAAPQQPREENLEYWRNKFQTLEGKYRSEVPRQASALREANDRIQRLEQTMSNMASAPAPAANALVSPEEVEEYGEDFVSMIRRVAQEEAGRAVSTVAPRIDEVRGELQQSRAQTAIDRVYAQLDSEVKDWRTINRSQDFLTWLEEEDPFAGQPRNVMLRDAFNRKDGPRVLTFFTGFLNEKRTIQPQAPAAPQTPPARTQPKVTLEQLAGPRGGNSNGGAHASEEAPIQPWTRRQIALFYKDVQTGVYKNDPAKRDLIERSINRASVNGLVTP